MADILTAEPPAPAGLGGQVAAKAAAEAAKYPSGPEGIGPMIKSRMPELVKGAGYVGVGANKPLDDYADIMGRSSDAALSIRLESSRGFQNKASVVGSMNQRWLDDHGAFKTALLQMSPKDYIDGLIGMLPGGGEAMKSMATKSWTAGNLGIGSVYGLTPFNLLAPSRLIYPVYTVYRQFCGGLAW